MGRGVSYTQHPCTLWHVARCFSLIRTIHSHSLFLFATRVVPLVISYHVLSSLHSQMSLHIYDRWGVIQLLRPHFGIYLLHWGVSCQNISQRRHNITYWKSKSVYGSWPGGPSEQEPLVPKIRGVGYAFLPSLVSLSGFSDAPRVSSVKG